MLLRKFSQTFKVSLALLFALLSTGILPTATAYATIPTTHEVICHETGAAGFVAIPPSSASSHIPGAPGHDEDFLIYATYPADTPWDDLKDRLDAQCNGEAEPDTITTPLVDQQVVCGPDNDVYSVVDGLNYDVVDNENGTYTLTAATGYVFTTTGTNTATLTAPEDMDTACPEDTITTPLVDQQVVCGPDNDVYSVVDGLNYDVVDNENGTYTLTAATGYVFTTTGTNTATLTAPEDMDTACPDSQSVTLCHATASAKNPFVRITVSAEGAYNGHLGNDHQDGEDIIPPFYYDGTQHSQNWDAEGRALYASENCASLSPTPCPAPANGGVITQNTSGWELVGDAEFVDGAVSISSGSWVDGGVSFTGTYSLADVEQLAWSLDASGVTGAYGVGILLETADGAVIHYEPGPYTDEFWSNSPVLPANGGGQGGPYSGSLQDALDTIGNVEIVKTTFVFTSNDVNEGVLLTGLSFNCATYAFDEAEEVQPVADIDAVVVCDAQGVKVTLTNSGDADGTATVNGTDYEVGADSSRVVMVPFAFGTPFIASVEVTVGETTVLTQNVNCTPGGQVLGVNTGGRGGAAPAQVLGASTQALPETLPSTGGADSPLAIIIASILAYGAAYFLQGRRLLGRKEALSA